MDGEYGEAKKLVKRKLEFETSVLLTNIASVVDSQSAFHSRSERRVSTKSDMIKLIFLYNYSW